MASSNTAVNLHINGVDRTRAVFATLQTRLRAVSARIRIAAGNATRILRNTLVGATGAAIALGLAIVKAAQSFSTLSDRAAQAGTTADELSRLSTALAVAGAHGADIETITQGLAYMSRTTGRAGISGFRQTLEEISALGDEGARVRELSRVFGRYFGPGLAALVRQGPDALRAGLDGVLAAMPKLNDALVNTGDAIADGYAIARTGVLQQVQSLLVEIGNHIIGTTGKSARELGATIAAYARYYREVFSANLSTLPALIGNILDEIGARLGHKLREWAGWLGDLFALAQQGFDFIGGLLSGKGFAQSAEDATAKAAETYEEQLDRIRAQRAALLQGTEEQRAQLDADLAAAANLDDALSQLATGAVGDFDGGVALASAQRAAAVAANSYDAFKIASQDTGNNPAQRAALQTADNTAATARDTARTARAVERLAASASSGGTLYTLE